jgi:hypothetical protein
MFWFEGLRGGVVRERDMKRGVVLLKSYGVSKREFVFSCCGARSVGASVERARTRLGVE